MASSRMTLAGSSATPTATTSTSAVDLVTVSGLNILQTQGIRIIINFRKTATAAQIASFGLKFNSTVVIEASSSAANSFGATTGTQQAEDGIAVVDIAPRSTNYQSGGMVGYYNSRLSSTGQNVATPAFCCQGTGLIPAATITSITIRAINNTSNNNAEVSSVQIWTLG